MNSIENIVPIGHRYDTTEYEDLSDNQNYIHWVETAKLYERALRARFLTQQAPRSTSISSEIRVLTLRVDHSDRANLDHALSTTYSNLQAGDMLVLDAPAPIFAGKDCASQRDLVSRALFKAGFDHSMIWAGRKVLEAENGSSIVNRFLPSSALGAGPPQIPSVTTPLKVLPQQIIAIGRRGELAPPAERTMRLSVVMPVYNERETFREVIERLLAKTIPGFEIEICIVESRSTDGTRDEVLRYKDHPRVRLLLEETPSGKGHAVRNGFQIASGDVILIQDADLEYDLDDYEKLLKPIVSFNSSFVLGSRHPAGSSAWQLRRFADQRAVADVMNIGHLFFTWFLNLIFRQSLRDPFTMYKVFRRDCINNVRFECNRFDFDHELVGKLIRNGFWPTEIDVHYESRSFRQGKKVSFFRDPPTWIKACIRHRFSSLHIWPASI